MSGAGSGADYNALLRENARLVAQNRRLQDLVGTMREEIADANAEIAACKRLHDEQRAVLLQRIGSEADAVQRLSLQLQDARSRVNMVSKSTNTYTDMSTSTVADAATNTASSFGFDAPPPSPPFHSSPRRIASAPAPRGARPSVAPEVQQFGEWLMRKSGFMGRDLGSLFGCDLGASSVAEVCATLQERDLVDYGVPIAKARGIMHLVMEHTSMLLSVAP